MRILWKNKETVTGIVFFLLSLFLLHEISVFPATGERIRSLGPEIFPNLLSVSLGILSIVLFIQGLRLPAAPLLSRDIRENKIFPALMILVGMVAFMLLLRIFGFLLWSVLFLIAIQYVFGERRALHICGIAVGISLVLYTVFAFFLKIQIPNGFFSS